ncbi:MAG: oligosaccharide flippase family protein [Actinomycetota bacterium]|nr:oligosaccharide flippase family protein [Actinomycetota bacterium]
MTLTDRGQGALRRSSIFAAVDVTGKLLALAAVAVLARTLDATKFGAVLTSLAGAAILSTVVDCGISQHLVAVVVEDSRRARAIATRRYQVVLAAALAGLLTSQLVPGLRLYALAAVAGVIVSLLPVGALLADGRLATAAAGLIGPNVLFLGYLVVRAPTSPTDVMGAWVVVNSAAVVVVSLRTPWLRPVRSPDLTFYEAARESLPLGLANIVGAAYGRVDILLVAAIVGTVAAGAYAANYRIVLALIGLAAWTSNLEARRLGDPEYTMETLRRLLRWALTAALSASIFLIAFLPVLVRTMLSPEQELPRLTVGLLALLTVPHIVSMPLAQLVILRHRQRALAHAAVIVGGAAIVLYPALISTWGVNGAAFASLSLETLDFVLVGRIVFRILSSEPDPGAPEDPDET